MVTITDKSQCCGCTACMYVCSHNAITMRPDDLGFLYPSVNVSLCVECGLCEKVCAFNSNYDKTENLSTPEVYAVRHKQKQEIETSRSGAVFIALSDWVLEHSGVVYGAGYTDCFRVIHKRAITKQERNEFKGSKYVQSDLNTTFLQVKNDLRKGLYVMFSGTPCQTSGLRSYLKLLKVKTEKLWLVDLVCHGVPGPYIWRDYLVYLEKKYGEKILSVNFRDKSSFGWDEHKESFLFANRKIVRETYSGLFSQCIMFRHSCGVCYFTNLQRPSDLTIGDFWGYEMVDTNLNIDNKGVSLLLVNSEKGRFLFNEIVKHINYVSTDVAHALQPNLQHPSFINKFRSQFEKDFIQKGFVYVGKKYGNMGFYSHCLRVLSLFKHKIFK